MATIILDPSFIGQTIAPASGHINQLLRLRAPTALTPGDGAFVLTDGSGRPFIADGYGGIMAHEMGYSQTPDGAILINCKPGQGLPFVGPLVCADLPQGQRFQLTINE